MPIPAVAIVVAGLGAVTSLGTTYMACKQQDKAREANKEMMEKMWERDDKRSEQFMEFMKWQTQMGYQQRSQMADWLSQSGYGDFAGQCLRRTIPAGFQGAPQQGSGQNWVQPSLFPKN